MHADQDRNLMRSAFATARTLEPTDAEVARVLERARRRRPRWTPVVGGRAGLVPVAASLLLLGAGAYAVPTTRAAIEDVADSLAGWVRGDEGAPGRALRAKEAMPDYYTDPAYAGEPRVLAEAGGYRLFVARTDDGSVEFDLGETGVGLGFDPATLTERAIYVLGPGSMETPDADGHVPLFGATARSVATVELLYESGEPLRADASNGGFVLLAEPARSPHEVVAYDAQGNEVGRQVVDESAESGPAIHWDDYALP